MDKYMKAQDEWLEATADNVMARTIPNAFRWYEDKYLAEALTAAVEMRMHASYTDAMLEEKREKETCEWKWDGDEANDTACGFLYAGRIILDGDEAKQPDPTFCPYCSRRIVEVRDEK